jgi:hypothetical protein
MIGFIRPNAAHAAIGIIFPKAAQAAVEQTRPKEAWASVGLTCPKTADHFVFFSLCRFRFFFPLPFLRFLCFVSLQFRFGFICFT